VWKLVDSNMLILAVETPSLAASSIYLVGPVDLYRAEIRFLCLDMLASSLSEVHRSP